MGTTPTRSYICVSPVSRTVRHAQVVSNCALCVYRITIQYHLEHVRMRVQVVVLLIANVFANYVMKLVKVALLQVLTNASTVYHNGVAQMRILPPQAVYAIYSQTLKKQLCYNYFDQIFENLHIAQIK